MTAETVPPLETPPVWVVSKSIAHDPMGEVYAPAEAGGYVLIRDDRVPGRELWLNCQAPPWWTDDSPSHRRQLADGHRPLDLAGFLAAAMVDPSDFRLAPTRHAREANGLPIKIHVLLSAWRARGHRSRNENMAGSLAFS
jgi:hypothetical protein